MSVYHHIRQLVVKDFFQQCMIFLENDKNWLSFVFTVLPKHIKIKSPLKDSVCGRVVKPSGLSSALSSYYRSITGSSLEGARFTHHFFSVILNYIVLSPSFSLLIHYISLYHIILLFSLIWVLLEKFFYS